MRLFVALVVLSFSPAVARDTGQWGDQSDIIREWFQSLMQPDTPWQSCCGAADAFEADAFEVQGDRYVAIITDGHGVIPNGTHILVPNKKRNLHDGNPTGHGIIFIGAGGQVYCFVAPGGA
jgi:hypothetical protein